MYLKKQVKISESLHERSVLHRTCPTLTPRIRSEFWFKGVQYSLTEISRRCYVTTDTHTAELRLPTPYDQCILREVCLASLAIRRTEFCQGQSTSDLEGAKMNDIGRPKQVKTRRLEVYANEK